jgi:hypothetical protein
MAAITLAQEDTDAREFAQTARATPLNRKLADENGTAIHPAYSVPFRTLSQE